ncbi:hypothetical protein [Actinomadura sp.]|jgi:hypothetical protein|uniref:Rv1733c family protein n=1 Tax=Actinomadura sp. TaxID=1989 RepID=UPI0033522729
MGRFEALLGRLNRRRRVLGFCRSGLWRAEDRVQLAAGVVLFMLFVIAGPVGAGFAAHAVYDAGVRAEQHQKATRRQVTATVVRPMGDPDGPGPAPPRTAVVSWTDPGGGRRSAGALLGLRHRTGETVRVWVDRSGRTTHPPQSRSTTGLRATIVLVTVPILAGALALTLHRLLRAGLDRFRYRRWDREISHLTPHL